MRGMKPGQLLVPDQQRDCRMVNFTQHGVPGRRYPDAIRRERLDQLRRRVRVDRTAVERRGYPGSELGQPGRTRAGRAGRRPASEQAAQQLVMHVGAPGYARVTHLRGHQAARRLGRHQRAEPGRVLVGGDLPQLASVGRDHRVELCGLVRLRPLRGLEQHVLRPAVAVEDDAVQDGAVACRGGPGCPVPHGGVPAGQQCRGQRHIVAAADPDAGPQQRRIDPCGTGPDPADLRPASLLIFRDRPGKIRRYNGRFQAAAVRPELTQQPISGRPGSDSDPHSSDCRAWV